MLSPYPLMLFTCLIFVPFFSLQECQVLCFCAAGVSKRHLVFFSLWVVNFLSFIVGKSSVSFCASFIFHVCPFFVFFSRCPSCLKLCLLCCMSFSRIFLYLSAIPFFIVFVMLPLDPLLSFYFFFISFFTLLLQQ